MTPTNTRAVALWAPTVSMMLVSLISYIDRNALALLAPTILAETKLSGEQYGYIISAFSIAYMAGNPLWGLLLDRFGVRTGMTGAVAFWTLASASHAFASGFGSFAWARALLGFGEGATFPGGLRTAVQSLPEHLRSRGIALAYSGGSLGAIVTPFLVIPIASRFGWRGAFWFTGLIGLLWLALWAWSGRKLTVHVRERHVGGMLPLLRDTQFWAFTAAYALGGLPLAFVIYGSSLYLNRVLGVTQNDMAKLLWIPPLGWEVGYFFWGWRADRHRMRGSVPYARLLGTVTVLSLPLAAVPFSTEIPAVIGGMFFSMFVAAGFVILSIGYATDTFSVRRSAFLAGAGAGSWSAVVAVAMPLFGKLFDGHRYHAAFAMAALFPAAGFATWYLLHRTSRTTGR